VTTAVLLVGGREDGKTGGEVPASRAGVVRTSRMRRSTRMLVGVGSLALGLLYLTPLWHIGLKAPQYPEGLGMYIWVNRMTGEKPQDLNSINGLNHYIGMKEIVPESFPELRYMPIAVGALIGLGLLTAVWSRREALYAWAAIFAVGALAGLADFWRWGYLYGHQLNPRAAIKIEGMSYQPPLVGGKQLLNFHASSWPGAGGWIAIVVLVTAVLLTVREWRSARSFAG
jgi:copper chaperone NosL